MSSQFWQLGLVGRGIGHSLSPRLQHALLRQSGRQGAYQLFDGEGWQAPLAAVAAGRLDGLNVTTPFKREVAEQCQLAQPGPINCVRFRDGRLQGWSSDGPGFADALSRLHALPDRAQVLVLGTGGAAESLVPVLAQHGWTVWLRGRHPHSGATWPERLPVRQWPWPLHGDALPRLDLVIHASRWGHGEVGLPPPDQCQAWQELPWLDWAATGTALVDIVYSANQPTWMEQLGQSRNLSVINGFGRSMLAAQAAQGFAYWTGDLRDWREIASEINAPTGLSR